MKIVIVSCFAVSHRLEYIEQTMKELGYDVKIIVADFNHKEKKKIINKNNDYTYINTKKYKRNMSFQRIYSHYNFSKKVVKELKRFNPDIIYSMIPPNFLSKYIIKYKKKNKRVKVIFDIIDLWPETIPNNKLKKILAIPFKYWSNLRNKNLKDADFVITECELYKKCLRNELPKNTTTIHLVDKYFGYKDSIKEEIIQIAYLGSINNIIDIDLIINILNEIKQYKSIKIHIIGEGESRQEFIEKLKENEIQYQYYGKVFEDNSKYNIFNKCQFGINVMKESTCVGLTLKSIDYFKFGLPIINNIKEDTMKIVEKYDVGFNIKESNLEEIALCISRMKKEEFIQMKENVSNMYKKEFEIEILKNKIKDIMEKIA